MADIIQAAAIQLRTTTSASLSTIREGQVVIKLDNDGKVENFRVGGSGSNNVSDPFYPNGVTKIRLGETEYTSSGGAVNLPGSTIWETGSASNSIKMPGCSASAANSVAIGQGTTVIAENGFAVGKYNYVVNGPIFSIGNGASNIDRRNLLEVRSNGSLYISGSGGYSGSGTTYAKSYQDLHKVNLIWTGTVKKSYLEGNPVIENQWGLYGNCTLTATASGELFYINFPSAYAGKILNSNIQVSARTSNQSIPQVVISSVVESSSTSTVGIRTSTILESETRRIYIAIFSTM